MFFGVMRRLPGGQIVWRLFPGGVALLLTPG